MRFVFQEGHIDLPEGTRDDSVQILTIPLPDALPLTLTIRRKVLSSEQPLAALVDAALNELGDRCISFEPSWRRSHRLDGQDAVIVAVNYTQGDSPVAQRLVYIKTGAQLLTLTGSVPGEFLSTHLGMLNSIAGSLRLTHEDTQQERNVIHG